MNKFTYIDLYFWGQFDWSNFLILSVIFYGIFTAVVVLAYITLDILNRYYKNPRLKRFTKQCWDLLCITSAAVSAAVVDVFIFYSLNQ